jgi:predicted permease
MSFFADLRHGFRRLRKSPGFTLLAVLCLGIGIGASVGVFSILNALLLRPIPGVESTQGLVSLLPKMAPLPGHSGVEIFQTLSYPSYLQYRETNRVFSELVAYSEFPVNLAIPGEGRPLRTSGHLVSNNYFSTLGVKSRLGLTLSDLPKNEVRQTGAVISHRLWRSHFGGRSDVLGRSLLLNGNVFEVIGVLPEKFLGVLRARPVEVWLPLEAAPLVVPRMAEGDLRDTKNTWLNYFFARLAPGVNISKAQTELDVMARMMAKEHPAAKPPAALEVFPEIGTIPGNRKHMIDPLATLATVAGLLMLLVCANLGGLLLTRAAARKGEIGIRVAFGATQGRLVRHLMTESLLLGVIGGAAGVALASGLVKVLEGVPLGRALPALTGLSLDRWVLVFALVISLGAAVVFGLAPALWSSRPEWIREGTALHARTGLQDVFLISQVALSLTLLVGAGLFVRTFRNLQAVPLGFESQGLVNFQFDLELQRLKEPAAQSFYHQLLDRVRTLPGVQAASLAAVIPVSDENQTMIFGQLVPPGSPDHPLFTRINAVAPGYFRTLGIPLVEGRDFSEQDGKEGTTLVIVSQTVAKKLWPGKSAVGQRVGNGFETEEIIGVVGDIRSRVEGDPEPLIYNSIAQIFMANLTLQVKTNGDPKALVRPVRAEVARLDRNLPIAKVSRMDEEVREVFGQSLLFSKLLGSLSGVALLLTGIGLYGSLAYAVRRRTREMGVRKALGARTPDLLGLILRRGLALTMVGLALGTAVSWLATRALSSLLFGVTPTDPEVFLSVLLICGIVGATASFLPAWSATRVDPMGALRQE